jgi:hypothetical protein
LYNIRERSMSEDSEKTKKLLTLRSKLEKRIEGLKSELEELQSMLDTLNSVLLEKGFKRAEFAKESTKPEAAPPSRRETLAEPELSYPQPLPEVETSVPLTTATGEPLATLYVSEDTLRVSPAADKSFNVNTPPFMSFLVERVFMKMQERDNELARAGQLLPDQIFSYNIVRQGDTIQEIIIRNVDAERLRELKSSIRWTLQKMYEKIRS